MNIIELEQRIIKWANDRSLFDKSNYEKQTLKTMEEFGELAKGFLKKDENLIIDSYGDIIITMIISLNQYFGIGKISIFECLSKAFYEIENRKGKTINGTFIKDD